VGKKTLAARLLHLGAATLGETGGLPMDPTIRPMWPGARLAAPAFPVRCPAGDNLAIHVGVVHAPTGAVLAVAVEAEPAHGYFGEVLATAAEARGLAGVVTNGGVRDVEALRAHGFPVFATLVALAGTTKRKAAEIGAPVELGGVRVAPGDWLVADADGVVVVASDGLEDTLARAEARAEHERELFAELRKGRTTIELLGLDPSPVAGPPVPQGPSLPAAPA
jgi:4-hydroxy-4-methyl-2-oxoglutarate aldolase